MSYLLRGLLPPSGSVEQHCPFMLIHSSFRIAPREFIIDPVHSGVTGATYSSPILKQPKQSRDQREARNGENDIPTTNLHPTNF